MNTRALFIVILSLTGASAAFGSGFKCEEDGGSLRAKVYNHRSPEAGTRTAAALLVSDMEEGTLLRREGTEIRKYNRANTVQYVVRGNRAVGADKVILQIRFKEGRETLEAGEIADAQLILADDDGARDVRSLTCERYLVD